jgi:hypothetical protein
VLGEEPGAAGSSPRTPFICAYNLPTNSVEEPVLEWTPQKSWRVTNISGSCSFDLSRVNRKKSLRLKNASLVSARYSFPFGCPSPFEVAASCCHHDGSKTLAVRRIRQVVRLVC